MRARCPVSLRIFRPSREGPPPRTSAGGDLQPSRSDAGLSHRDRTGRGARARPDARLCSRRRRCRGFWTSGRQGQVPHHECRPQKEPHRQELAGTLHPVGESHCRLVGMLQRPGSPSSVKALARTVPPNPMSGAATGHRRVSRHRDPPSGLAPRSLKVLDQQEVGPLVPDPGPGHNPSVVRRRQPWLAGDRAVEQRNLHDSPRRRIE